MLTKKQAAKSDKQKAASETQSFKTSMRGFKRDEVNLYISSLRKKLIEITEEHERLVVSSNPDGAARIETLERLISEADERYIREKEHSATLEAECVRLKEQLGNIAGGAPAVTPVPSSAPLELPVPTPTSTPVPTNDFASAFTEFQMPDTSASDIGHSSAAEELSAASAPAFDFTSEFAEFQVPIEQPFVPEIPGVPETPALDAQSAETLNPSVIPDFSSDFADFQLPATATPEAPDIPEIPVLSNAAPPDNSVALEEKLNAVLLEIDELKNKLAKAESRKSEETFSEKVGKSQEEEENSIKKEPENTEETDIDGETVSLKDAVLKVQSLMGVSEDSYIIPEKYLNIEDDSQDDDFSSLLAELPDSNPASANTVQSPAYNQVPPAYSQTRQPIYNQPQPMYSQTHHGYNQAPQEASRASRIEFVRPAPQKRPRVDNIVLQPELKLRDDVSTSLSGMYINHENTRNDYRFEEQLNRDFLNNDPIGDDLSPLNPFQTERGQNLIANNPHQVEKGSDLSEDLYEVRIGEIGSSDYGRYENDISDDDDMSTNAGLLNQII